MKSNINNTKVVMKFMGLEPFYFDGKYSISKDGCHSSTPVAQDTINSFAAIAKYHISYNWFMPVYFKILDVIAELMDGTNGDHDSSIGNMGISILDGDLEEALEEAVIAVEWYNKNKN